MPATKTSPARKRGAARPAYHHGDLRAALIEATESLLAERGLDGFSLREVARRSGVSPAAPAHHFGDSDGLLTAVATLAFDGLTAELRAGNTRGGADPVARLREQGVGYVGFALRHPGRFGLMFRTAVRKDDALRVSAQAAFGVLEDGVRGLYGVAATVPLTPVQWHTLLTVWSVVHGFAHLALAGQFDRLLGCEAAAAQGRAVLLGEVLPGMLQAQLRALVPAAAPVRQ
jgi:AcrR family transcriptional regulator